MPRRPISSAKRIGHVRNVLRGVELRIAFHDPLLPGDLVEILVVEDADDPAMVLPLPPVFRDGDQLGHVVHLHRAIADERDDRPIRMGEFRGDGVGHRCAHRGETAGQRGHHAAAHLQVARIPVRAGARVARDDRTRPATAATIPRRRAAD